MYFVEFSKLKGLSTPMAIGIKTWKVLMEKASKSITTSEVCDTRLGGETP